MLREERLANVKLVDLQSIKDYRLLLLAEIRSKVDGVAIEAITMISELILLARFTVAS